MESKIPQARKDGEAKLTKIVEDNFNLMRSDLSKETKLRVEIMENLNQALEVHKKNQFFFYKICL